MKYRIKVRTISPNKAFYWPQKRFLFWWENISGVSTSIYQAKEDIEQDKIKVTVTYVDYEKWKNERLL